jgi:hypothetical protein
MSFTVTHGLKIGSSIRRFEDHGQVVISRDLHNDAVAPTRGVGGDRAVDSYRHRQPCGRFAEVIGTAPWLHFGNRIARGTSQSDQAVDRNWLRLVVCDRHAYPSTTCPHRRCGRAEPWEMTGLDNACAVHRVDTLVVCAGQRVLFRCSRAIRATRRASPAAPARR